MNLMHFAIHSLVDAGQGHAASGHVVDLPSTAAGREPRPTGILQRLGQRFATAVARFHARRAELKALDALSRLDDRMLHDIGLRRSDLDAVHAGMTSLGQLNAERGGHRPANLTPFPPQRREGVEAETPEATATGLARSA